MSLKVPNEWEVVSIKSVTDYVDYRGKTPKKVEYGTFLVTAKNIKEGYIDYELSKEYIPTDEYNEVMRRGRPKIGDVLITTEAPCGNVAQIDNENVALAQRIIKYRAKRNFLDNTFLKYYFLSEKFQNILLVNSTGGTVKGIKGSRLHQLPIILPPVPEQEKIAQILSKWDEGIELCEKLIEKKELLKKGLMQKLLTGKTRFKEFGEPSKNGELPKGWEVKKLQDIAFTNKTTLSDNTDESYCFSYIDLSSVDKGIINYPKSKITFKDSPSRARRVVKKYDVLMSTVRPYLLAFAKIDSDIEDTICSTGFAVLSPFINSDYSYIYHLLFTNSLINQVNKLLAGSNYPAINSSEVKNLGIIYPKNVHERIIIASVLSLADKEIELLKKKRDQLKLQKKSLMQKLLTGQVRVKV